MAFNFNSVNDQLQDKANIFATGDGMQTVGGSTDTGNVTPTVTPTSAPGASQSGSVSAAPHVKGSGSGGSANNPAATQKAYDAMGPSNYQAQTDNIGSKISSANDKLQQEANAYTAKANTTAQGYKVDDQALNQAASGDADSFASVASRLSKSQPDQYEAFKGLSDDEIPTAASAISKPTNFGDIYAQSAGPNYSTGANRLNSMQLRRSGDFRNIAMQLGRQNQDLLESNNTQQTKLTDSTRAGLGQAYGAATKDAKSRLTGMGDQVIKAAKLQEQAEEERRRGLDLSQISSAEYAKLKPDQLAQLQAAGLSRSSDLLDQNFDLSPYAKVNTDVNYTDFLDNQGAAKYNRINSLLGNGNPILSKTKMADEYNFDANGANQYIKGQVEAKQLARDQQSQDQIDKLMANAGARAAADPGDALTNAQNYVKDHYLKDNQGQTEQQIRAEQEAYRQLFNPETNWNPYYQSQGALNAPGGPAKTAADVLTPEEAAQLNGLQRMRGEEETYKAGGSQNPMNYNQQYFDDHFKKTFDRILAEINGQSLNTGSGITRDKIVNPLVKPNTALGNATSTRRQN